MSYITSFILYNRYFNIVMTYLFSNNQNNQNEELKNNLGTYIDLELDLEMGGGTCYTIEKIPFKNTFIHSSPLTTNKIKTIENSFTIDYGNDYGQFIDINIDIDIGKSGYNYFF